MKARARFGLLIVALAVLAGLLATPAPAAPATPATPAAQPDDEGAFGAFSLEGTHGYRIYGIALAEPHTDGKGAVVLSVIHKGFSHRHGSGVVYIVPATVTSNLQPLGQPALSTSIATSIQADLGVLGKISVEFRPSGGERTYRSPCRPKDQVTYPTGSYDGTIELSGEEGFTRVSATQTPLSFRPTAVLFDCATEGASESQGPVFPGASLRAHSGTQRRRVQIGAVQNRPGASVHLSATLTERHGEIRIRRSVIATAPASAFSFDPKLRFASLAPPAPFAGTATFRRDVPIARRLGGNLTIDFPGSSNFPIAGPGLRAQLVHAAFGKHVEGG